MSTIDRLHVRRLTHHALLSVQRCVQVDLLTEINQAPMFQAPTAAQLPPALAAEVQDWVAGLQPPGFPASLAARFLLPPAEATLTNQRYNVTLLNSFVFFVGLTVSILFADTTFMTSRSSAFISPALWLDQAFAHCPIFLTLLLSG